MANLHIRKHLLSAHGIDRPRRTKRSAQPQLLTDPEPNEPDAPPAEPEPDTPPTPPEPETPTETVPRKPGALSRLRSRLGRGGTGHDAVPASGERTPRAKRTSRRRLPLDADISDIWAFAGRRLAATPHYPTGRMLEYQAPAAGVILDRAVAGTLPDRVLFQPMARNRDRYEDVGFLLAGPILTFSITSTMGQLQAAQDAGDPELFEDLAAKLTMQREMFAWVLALMLPRLAVGAKQAAEKKAKRDKVIADAFPELGLDDPVEQLMTMLFTPPNFQEAAQNGKQPDDRPAADVGQPHDFSFGE